MSVTIRDPLYGMITIPKLCARFLDTAEFERLRNIRQLGLCYYVFPSATHTRFEHCLGTCHLASLVCNELHHFISQREKDLVCLAAMWHDVGHMAFSHLMDSYLEECLQEQKLVHHEARSVSALITANSRLQCLSDMEVKMVSKMILGDTAGESKPFLFEIVSNRRCGVDVDRLDYLQRDAYHTGHAGFQPDYIIKCVCIKNNQLAFKQKAEEELLNMFQTRRRLFRIIYHHKTTRKVEFLMQSTLNATQLSPQSMLDEWDTWDDYEMIVHMRKRCPKTFQILAARNFSAIPDQEATPDKDVNGYMEHLVFV